MSWVSNGLDICTYETVWLPKLSASAFQKKISNLGTHPLIDVC